MNVSDKEKALADLSKKVMGEVSEKRYRHILGVEQCAVRMAEYFSDVLDDEDIFFLRASALLHDVTKDKGLVWQKNFICNNAVKVPDGDEKSSQLWHSFTAPAYISLTYPDFLDERVLSAVYKHATGDECMSVADKIICLADYIEDGRKYESCVDTRKRFFEFDFAVVSKAERIKHLDYCLLCSLLYVEEHLKTSGEKISNKTKKAIEALRKEINSTEVS